ncbi:MAG: hypothetical protein AB7O66_22125, partial [Limisphaerales bacterium]
KGVYGLCPYEVLERAGLEVVMAASHKQHMKKTLERMNLKIQDVISNLSGVSGLRVAEAILVGERNAAAMALTKRTGDPCAGPAGAARFFRR